MRRGPILAKLFPVITSSPPMGGPHIEAITAAKRVTHEFLQIIDPIFILCPASLNQLWVWTSQFNICQERPAALGSGSHLLKLLSLIDLTKKVMKTAGGNLQSLLIYLCLLLKSGNPAFASVSLKLQVFMQDFKKIISTKTQILSPSSPTNILPEKRTS